MIDKTSFQQVSFKQNSFSCVLASYAVGASPFLQAEVPDFFRAYERHYHLPSYDDLELSYNRHFHPFSQPPRSGYKIIEDLHSNSDQSPFRECRATFDLVLIADVKTEIQQLEAILTDTRSLLLVFLTNPNLPGIAHAHSVTIGRDQTGYYIYDVNHGSVLPYNLGSLVELATMNDGILITPKQ